ncbi:MAG: cysteine desulfurase, partial [Bdellovibrio sp. CG10_big_fil_rev_8_21_14_0_10_47_8]
MKQESKAQIYLDFNATTPLSSDLAARLGEVAIESWGNPSSIHWAGQKSKKIIREARQFVAQSLGVHPLEIIFTSGGSEVNNQVLQSVFEKSRASGRNEFITSKIEHPSIVKTLQHLKSLGAIIHEIPVDLDGSWSWSAFEKVLSERTALVTVMLANNETGLVLPIRQISEKAHAVGALVHTDAVQALGKIPVNLKELGVDFASFSAHKFYALKGAGALYCRKGLDPRPLIFGGGQERQRRGGTENTLGIWSFGEMSKRASEVSAQAEKMLALRDRMELKISQLIEGVRVTHQRALRLPNTSSLVIEGVDGDSLLMSLDVQGFAVST